MGIFSYHLLFMLLPTLLYILPATVSYRYLTARVIMSPIYGSKTSSITGASRFPHHVLIVYGSKYCSGSLIYSRIVLTAASCFMKHKGEAVIVKVGANSMTGNGQIIPVLEYKIHEYFEQLGPLDNDIALLILKHNVFFERKIMKAVFVEPEVALRVGTFIIMTGWGGTNMAVKYLNLLIKAETIVLNIAECKNIYDNILTPSNFCVKYVSEQILNDNGGGAMSDETLVGILSTGLNYTKTYNTAILTNVSYFHRWITLNTKRFLNKHCVLIQESNNNTVDSDET